MIHKGGKLFETFRITEPGGREVNQDYCDFAVLAERACWALADGLGGHIGGELASRAAVEAVLESFQEYPELSAAALKCHLLAAQCAILSLQVEKPELSEMRTTIVVAVCDSGSVRWAHIGDSRLYHFRGGRLLHHTLDHSVPQMLVDSGDISGDQIRHHPDRSRLLHAMGERGAIRPTIGDKEPLHKGDALLLCTDGFWEYVQENEMESDLQESLAPQEWITQAQSRLLSRVPEDHDNYSAIAVFYAGRGLGLPVLSLPVKVGLGLICTIALLYVAIVSLHGTNKSGSPKGNPNPTATGPIKPQSIPAPAVKKTSANQTSMGPKKGKNGR